MHKVRFLVPTPAMERAQIDRQPDAHFRPRWSAFAALLALRGVARGRRSIKENIPQRWRNVRGRLGVKQRTAEWRLASPG